MIPSIRLHAYLQIQQKPFRENTYHTNQNMYIYIVTQIQPDIL